MTFTAAVKTCLRKYFTFSGRASRREYWWFFLAVFLGSSITGIIDLMLFGGTDIDPETGQAAAQSSGPLNSLFSFFTIVPVLSAGWRRMHDSGRSGLYLLYPMIVMIGIGTALAFFGGIGALNENETSNLAAIILIPALIVLVISPFIVLWWLTRPSQSGENQYGPNPHDIHRPEEVTQ